MARNKLCSSCVAVAICLLFVLLFSDSHASHTDGDILPDVTLDTNANELTVFDNASVNVICSSSLSSSSLSWLRVTGSNPMTVGDSSTNLVTTNTTRQLTVTISIMDLGDSTSVEYYCTASNDLGVVRSKSLRVRRAQFGGFSTPSGVVNVTVRTGHAVALDCGVEGSLPVPAIRWLMNETPVDLGLAKYRVLDNAQYLVIYNLMDSDIQMGGVPVNYQCQVTNANASSTVTSPTIYNLIKTDMFANGFMIYRHPNNIVIFSNTTSADMFTVYIIAAINGMANVINYLRFPNGVINLNDLSITFTGLELEEEATQRDGLIMITLQRQTTSLAGSTVNVSITVLDPITILSTVPSGIIRGFTGDMFSFNCTASGTEVQLDWYRNASKLTQSSSILSISNASLADTGVYQCYWSSSTLNMFRIVTWALVISDPVRPMVTQFLSMPAEVETRRTVTNGTGVTLHLTVRADSLPTFTWRFRGVAISESSTDYNISSTVEVEQGDGHQYMSILTIHRVTNATSGEYHAVINDGRTDPVTTPTQLVSLPRPPSVVSFVPSKGCLLSMSVVSLTCKADGLPTPTITFLKDAADFRCDSTPTCNISNGVLTFTQPAPTDAERYGCRAASTFDGEELTDTNTIDIQYCTLPGISNVSSPDTVMSGGQAILTCTVSGTPLDQVKVNWTFGTTPIPETGSGKYTPSTLSGGSRHQLIINNLNASDTGMYYCNAFHQLLPNEPPIRRSVQLTVMSTDGTFLPVWSFPLMALGGVLVLLLIVAICFLAILCCCYSNKRDAYTPSGKSFREDTDGRGNVDRDSDDEGEKEEMEEFRPQYESLPALRPAQPPQYKPSPAYNQQYGVGDDDIVKMPPPETDFEMQQYRPDNGSVVNEGYPGQQARFDDFMSDDGQFV